MKKKKLAKMIQAPMSNNHLAGSTNTIPKNSEWKKAVLFLNLGTPKSWKPWDVGCYLNQFLTDERVIDLPWLFRHLLVKAAIIPTRIITSSRNYRSVWTKEGSPLMVHSLDFIEKIRPILQEQGIEPFFAMRYQEPSIPTVMRTISEFSPDELYILPLYPQYASATTGSSIEACMEAMKRWSFFPKLHFLSSFYSDPWFIETWAKKLQKELITDSHIVFCFHGLPQRQVLKTNPRGVCFTQGCCHNKRMKGACYVAQCYDIAQNISEKINLSTCRWSLAFQSRLGKDPWTEPYLMEHLKELASQGIKKVTILSPSFVADCIETIEELGQEARTFFLSNGGKEFHLVSSLNDNDEWVSAIAEYVISLFQKKST